MFNMQVLKKFKLSIEFLTSRKKEKKKTQQKPGS